VSEVEDNEVLGALEHEILDKASKATDSKRFKNVIPGGNYNPKNKNTSGEVYLLRFSDQYDKIQSESQPKDFSGPAYFFQACQSSCTQS